MPSKSIRYSIMHRLLTVTITYTPQAWKEQFKQRIEILQTVLHICRLFNCAFAIVSVFLTALSKPHEFFVLLKESLPRYLPEICAVM